MRHTLLGSQVYTRIRGSKVCTIFGVFKLNKLNKLNSNKPKTFLTGYGVPRQKIFRCFPPATGGKSGQYQLIFYRRETNSSKTKSPVFFPLNLGNASVHWLIFSEEKPILLGYYLGYFSRLKMISTPCIRKYCSVETDAAVQTVYRLRWRVS